VSNVFGRGVWADIPAAVAAAYPALPLVGYEQGDALDDALAAGFTAIGPLGCARPYGPSSVAAGLSGSGVRVGTRA
jgi:hypothetical protein